MDLVILDRDGVINEDSDAYIKSPAEWRPIDGSLEAIVKLRNAGFRIAVASNQSGLARELFDYDALFAIHDKMIRMLTELGGQIDGVFFCPHGPAADCDCRKPDPGLLEDIGRRFARPLKDVPFIGDSDSDMQAARAVGARAIGVKTGKSDAFEDHAGSEIEVYDDLATAAAVLIAERRGRRRQDTA